MRHTRRWRYLFTAYAVLLAVATHWPGLTIEAPVPRPDLLVHAGVFAVWTALCARSSLLGRWGDWRNIAAAGAVALAFAGLDEWTQQFVNRHSAWDDYLANILGIAIGTSGVAVWTWHWRNRSASDNRGPC